MFHFYNYYHSLLLCTITLFYLSTNCVLSVFIKRILELEVSTCSTPCGVHFKLATLMFKSLHGVTVACRLISQMHASRRLSSVAVSARLAPSHALIRSSRTRLGDKSFDVAGPRLRRLWNKLPASLQSFDGLCSEDS